MSFVKGKSKLVFKVPDSIGESMISSGHVKRATEAEYRKQRKAAPTVPETVTPPQVGESESQVAEETANGEPETTGQEVTEEADGATPDETPAGDKPAGNASTDAWRDYALAQGYSEEQLESLGRDEIKSLLG